MTRPKPKSRRPKMARTKTIFTVEGRAGEYEDHREWPVRAFYCEDEAKGLVAELQTHADRLKAWKDEDWERWDAEPPESPKVAHPLDRNYDDSGTTYSYYQLELVGKEKTPAKSGGRKR